MARRRLNARVNREGRFRSARLLFALAWSTAIGSAQIRPIPQSHFQYTDMAAPASGERRAALSCQVTADEPGLGFDLRFHSDYRVTLPIKVLADVGDQLQVAIRVTPVSNPDKPVYLIRGYSVPDVPPEEKGEVELTGGFDLGLGRYQEGRNQ